MKKMYVIVAVERNTVMFTDIAANSEHPDNYVDVVNEVKLELRKVIVVPPIIEIIVRKK